MKTITLNVAQIDNSIEKLKSLHNKCADMKSSAPTTKGGGNTVNELEAIGLLYGELKTDVAELISNTILFLGNVKNSFISSDETAAKNMN